MLFLEDGLAPHSREFEQHSSDDFLCGYLGLEPEPPVNIVAAFLLLVEHPAAAADHDVLAQFCEIGGDFHLGLDEVCCVVVSDSIGAIIAVSVTYNISPSRVVTHLINDTILLSFDAPVGAIENSTIGHMR